MSFDERFYLSNKDFVSRTDIMYVSILYDIFTVLVIIYIALLLTPFIMFAVFIVHPIRRIVFAGFTSVRFFFFFLFFSTMDSL